MTDPDLFAEPPGATPLDPEAAVALIPTWVATSEDLNTAESDNVAAAVTWAFATHGSWTVDELLSEKMLRAIHRRMFDSVWKWAGEYRRSNVNLGGPWYEVPDRVHALVGDLRYQCEHVDSLPWSPDEIAVRFHHRLVSIHPFPNGNGRHARLAADILVSCFGLPAFSWGQIGLSQEGEARERYLEALHIADDKDDPGPLAHFARS